MSELDIFQHKCKQLRLVSAPFVKLGVELPLYDALGILIGLSVPHNQHVDFTHETEEARYCIYVSTRDSFNMFKSMFNVNALLKNTRNLAFWMF